MSPNPSDDVSIFEAEKIMLARETSAIAVFRTPAQVEAAYVAAMMSPPWDWFNCPSELMVMWEGGTWEQYQAVIDYLQLQQRSAPRG